MCLNQCMSDIVIHFKDKLFAANNTLYLLSLYLLPSLYQKHKSSDCFVRNTDIVFHFMIALIPLFHVMSLMSCLLITIFNNIFFNCFSELNFQKTCQKWTQIMCQSN